MAYKRLGIVKECLKQEFRQKMTAAAFTAYLSGAGGKNNFNEYLELIGLSEKPHKEQSLSAKDIVAYYESKRAKRQKVK